METTVKRALVMAACLLLARFAAAESTAFVNVNVIDVDSGAIARSQTVIVNDGIIETIGDFADTPVADDAAVVDGTDRFLMPGLTEMHGHVPGGGSASLERVLTLYVANGVTTVRGMLGEPSHLELRRRIDAGEVLGPRLITSGPSFNGNSVSSPRQAEAMVREQHAAGYDFLKIHPGLTQGEFAVIADTANELGIPFAGHVPEDVGVERALAAGIATIDHLDGYMQALLLPHEDPSGGLGGFFGVFIADLADTAKIDEIARLTADAGTWNVPTQSLFEHVTSPDLPADELVDRPEMAYMPAANVEQWRQSKASLVNEANYDAGTAVRAIEVRRALLRALDAAGAGLLLGSDSPQIFNVPGFALHHELASLVEAGLDPLTVLQAGTKNPPIFFGIEDRLGAVRPGMQADLLLLDENPLDDIGNSRRIHGVMLQGRWLPRTALDAMLERYER
jgi:imidazolonepropionase-like amidohydrolase